MIMFNNYAELLEKKNLILMLNPNTCSEISNPWQLFGKIEISLLDLFKAEENAICAFCDDLCGTGEYGFVISPVESFENEMFELSAHFPEYTFNALAISVTGEYLTTCQFNNGKISTITDVQSPFKKIVDNLFSAEEKEWLTSDEYFN